MSVYLFDTKIDNVPFLSFMLSNLSSSNVYFGKEYDITSSTPNFGQKKRVKKSKPDPAGAGPVTITPLPEHTLIS